MRRPERPTPLKDLFDQIGRDRWGAVMQATSPTTEDGKYRHWDTLRRIAPPSGLSSEEWWLATKMGRQPLLKELPLRAVDGRPFLYAMPDAAHEMAHRIDQMASGQIGVLEEVVNSQSRTQYVVSSLIEEAITSSQLEGAATTRLVAKEMIRSGRQPRDVDERMILNNFQTMQYVTQVVAEPLTPELVLELHRMLTVETLEKDAVGRLQQPGEPRVQVVDALGNVLHDPPPAEELAKRLEAMCAFANGDLGGPGFMHPLARAVLLHFWLAYDHPFVDGNGRTARALFYWSMLRQGYWLTEFLSISRILRKAPAQYGRAFLYCETDDNDATYFLLYQLKVMCRAIDELHEYLHRKMAEVRAVDAAMRSSGRFNHRQRALLSHALRHPDARYTFQSHAMSHQVVRQSARTDLLQLEAGGLLDRGKQGRAVCFTPVKDLARQLGKA